MYADGGLATTALSAANKKLQQRCLLPEHADTNACVQLRCALDASKCTNTCQSGEDCFLRTGTKFTSGMDACRYAFDDAVCNAPLP